jgi:hypothetical protein
MYTNMPWPVTHGGNNKSNFYILLCILLLFFILLFLDSFFVGVAVIVLGLEIVSEKEIIDSFLYS